MEVNGNGCDSGKGSSNWPGETPAGEPGLADGGCGLLLRMLNGRQGEGDDDAALGADGQVIEHLHTLVRGQSVLGEGADLVRIGMGAGRVAELV